MTDSLGQLMIVGFEGTKATGDIISFIRDEAIGGVILFKRNYESLRQLKRLTGELQDAAEGRLIISVDHEGGRVMRFGPPFTQFPAAARVAEMGLEAVHEVGLKMGRELSDAGINLDFAPVLDVATNAFNTVIGDRAFGGDPLAVADHAIQMMKGLWEAGVVPCGKHVPGHGDTDLDSHLSLPVIPHTKRRLELCELHPFRVAIAAGIPMIMTAHLLVPNLDSNWPASVSRRITTELLRKELGFKGVIITDDLRMKGITNLMPVPDAAVKAMEAGHDMVMICRDFELQRRTLDALKRAADEGRISDIETRLNRIKKLK
jgi:beta-N-acetylhexosaminidase